MSLQCKNVKAHTLYVLFPFSISVYLFLLPRLTSSLCLSPPLCSSGYSLLHVTREDTWKRIQLQVWHLVARMPALRGKLWQRVRTLSPRSRLWEWHENTSAQTHTHTNKLTVVTLAWRRGLQDDIHKCKTPPVLPHTGELYLHSPLPQVIFCKM